MVVITTSLFQQACGVLNVDVISMRLDERLPFKMKHTQIGQVTALGTDGHVCLYFTQAVSRGVHFEISYSPAIRGTEFCFQSESN